MKKGDIVEGLEISSISSEGKGVGRINRQVIFVKDTVPGDVIDAKVTSKKRKFMEGSIEMFHSKSKERKEPFCQHFGLCGGCKWQHMSYGAQLKYKQKNVEENLGKLSGIELPKVLPIIGSAKTSFYRNKLEYTFSNFRWLTREEIDADTEHLRTGLGFHIPKRFDKVLNIHQCYLQPNPSNEIRLSVKAYADNHQLPFFNLKQQKGFLRNLIIRTSTNGDIMVILQVFYHDQELLCSILSFLKKKWPQITSLMYVVNEKKNDSFHDLKVELFAGADHIMEEMGDLKFKVGPKSFYQTNSEQAHQLYKVIAQFAELKRDELVYDLYTGIGTIANFVARSAEKVIGIEHMESATENARTNSTINGIANTVFYAGDMKDVLVDTFIENHGKPDVVITDPPRAGMHPQVTQLLTDLRAERIVYVSCNPATQARDLQVLGKVYDVVKVQPIDMFPQTWHVENVVLLKLKSQQLMKRHDYFVKKKGES